MKILVTGGCSFSEVRDHTTTLEQGGGTWPHILKLLCFDEYQHIATGVTAYSNGLISRKVMQTVCQLLDAGEHTDIVVGIMWSGPERAEIYEKNAWRIMYRNSPEYKNVFTYMHNHVGCLVTTCEHILRMQWFLQRNNIKYFMTTYTSEVLPDICKTHPDIKYLYDQIDQSYFLPVQGEYEWCRDFSNLPFPKFDGESQRGDWKHPSWPQHRAFTEQVIVPFLKQKGYT